MESAPRSRGRMFAALLIAASAIVPLLASPAAIASDPVDEFIQLMSEGGYTISGHTEANQILSASGVTAQEANQVLEADSAAAEVFLPLVVENVEFTSVPVNGTSGSSCKTDTWRTNLKGVITRQLLMWHQLSSNHCYNGTKIIGTPTANVTSGRSALGISLGYKWTSTPALSSSGWVKYQTQYRFVEQGSYSVCPSQLFICFGGSSPWIRHDKYASGSTIGRYGR